MEAGFSYRNYRQYMHDAVLKFVIMIIILVALSRYGFYWFFYGLLVTPLKALTKGVYAVESGNFEVSVPVFVEDEIGYITHAFNTMVASIKETKRKLQDEANNLLAAHASLEASHHEIRVLQHYLSNIIESMPSVLISIDEFAKVTQWNAAAEKLTGIRATDILGKTLWKVRSPLNKLENYYHEVIHSQKPLLFSREQLAYTVDGEKGENKYYNIALYPLVANGISGAVVRIDDITELEKMEQQLRQAQKMDTIGTLASGLAHDFNNILGGIVGTLSILKFKLAKGMPLSPEATNEYIETMERAGTRATEMVQQLLTLSRKQELSVQDTGIGMDTKTIAKIFDPFFTTKEKGRGTGLGLAMVYNIIQQHKGFIDVYSEKGHGSTFSIYLPQMKGGSETPLKKTAKTLPTGEGAILIIDDEEIMREMAKDILTECGYTTILAENGSEGLEIFKTEHARIVMVLLDMVMPKMSGKETFIEMKQLDPCVKVLLTSGFSRNEDIEGILDLGVVDFIQKPFTLEDLAKKTNAIVHRKP